MKFYTNDFEDMDRMPVRFTADAENISPQFVLEEVPEETISLAILCHDPDATRGIPWVHWFVYSIPPHTQLLSSQNLPEGSIEGLNSFGLHGYGGPSPAAGTGPHRYVFTLYALNDDVVYEEKELTYEEINSSLEPFIIDKQVWTGIYQRT